MELVEFTPEMLQKLKNDGYKYIIHTKPTPQEEIELECCELSLIKYIPVKDIVEAEDYERTLGKETHKIELEEALHEWEEASGGEILAKIFIEEKYVR